MSWHPIQLPKHNCMPPGAGPLVLNKNSPYYQALDFEWVAGLRQCLDTTGRRIVRPDTVAPTRTVTAEGTTTHFADATEDALLVTGGALIDTSKPWSVALSIFWNDNGLINYALNAETTATAPIQFGFSAVTNYLDLTVASSNIGEFPRLESGASFAPAGQWNHCVIVFNGGTVTTRGNYRFYANGNVVAPLVGSAVGVSVNETRIGRQNTSTRVFYGDEALIRSWTRALSPSLALEHSRRPWAPFGTPISYRADTPVFYFVSAGAPPTGRIMSSLAASGGLAGKGGIAGQGGGLAG